LSAEEAGSLSQGTYEKNNYYNFIS